MAVQKPVKSRLVVAARGGGFFSEKVVYFHGVLGPPSWPGCSPGSGRAWPRIDPAFRCSLPRSRGRNPGRCFHRVLGRRQARQIISGDKNPRAPGRGPPACALRSVAVREPLYQRAHLHLRPGRWLGAAAPNHPFSRRRGALPEADSSSGAKVRRNGSAVPGDLGSAVAPVQPPEGTFQTRSVVSSLAVRRRASHRA